MVPLGHDNHDRSRSAAPPAADPPAGLPPSGRSSQLPRAASPAAPPHAAPPSWRRRIASVAAVVALGLVGVPWSQSSAAAAEHAYPDVTIHRVTSQGFTHPGISVSADSLENVRKQVRAGTEPWASYYAAMASTSYASSAFSSKNSSTTPDRPGTDVFDSQGVEAMFIDDAMHAYTQALMYFIDGDPVYRENALKIIRIWSHMDPNAYAVYPDARIHAGSPLQKMTAAAEIIRYTSVNAPSADGYDLTWRPSDTSNLVANLVQPITKTYLSSATNFMSQHSYSLVGAMAGDIFADDRAGYDTSVERFSVNSANPDDTTNGALSKVMPLIAKNNPLNTTGKSFVQLNEMGRDQAHAWDDVSMLTQIARLISVQGTKLDPVAGTVSTKSNAVTPYEFGGDRLLKGAEQYVAFMMGKNIPYVDVTGQGGQLSQDFRGRIFDPTRELYDVYTYDERVNVKKVAPSIAELATRQDDGPVFYWGTSAYNFWNSNPDWAADAWLSFPSSLARTAPPADPNALVDAETRGTAITNGVKIRSDGDVGYAELKASAKGTTLAMRNLLYPSQNGYSPVGVRIRTNGTATLQVAAVRGKTPYVTLTLPDTRGQWRYVTYDMDNAKLLGAGGASLAYYTVVGRPSVRVDIDGVDLQAKDHLTIPQFAAGSQTRVIAVTGEKTSFDLSATDTGGTVTYAAGTALPKGAALDTRTGTLTWQPAAASTASTFVVAGDGTTDTTLDVTMVAAATRQDAVTAAMDGYDSSKSYTTATLAALDAAQQDATAAISSADSATFAGKIAALQKAVAGLQLVSPRLAGDGSLNYLGLATSQQLSQVALANMLDGDSNTYSGDLTTPSILDFGLGFGVTADAFGLQARYNFANRSQGANVYGSNDVRTWTLLTAKETTDTSAEGYVMEKLPVRDAVKGQTFRWLKIQVDDPGPDTDPAYPGLSSFSEFRVYGDRVEFPNLLSSVSIASGGADPATAQDGDTVTVSFTSTQPLSDIKVAIEGAAATVSRKDDTHWSASYTLPSDVAFGRAAQFSIDYTTADGRRGATALGTTDGSSVQLWNSHVTQVPVDTSWAMASSPSFGGAVTAAVNGQRMFDGDTSTYTDTSDSNGSVTLTPPVGTTLTFDAVRVHPRTDFPGRANGTQIQVSTDGTTWTTVATVSGVADGNSWYSFLLAKEVTAAQVRVSDGHGGFTNLAEVQLLEGPTS